MVGTFLLGTSENALNPSPTVVEFDTTACLECNSDNWKLQLFGSILESFRKDFNLSSETHITLFPYLLYPMNQVAISGST